MVNELGLQTEFTLRVISVSGRPSSCGELRGSSILPITLRALGAVREVRFLTLRERNLPLSPLRGEVFLLFFSKKEEDSWLNRVLAKFFFMSPTGHKEKILGRRASARGPISPFGCPAKAGQPKGDWALPSSAR